MIERYCLDIRMLLDEIEQHETASDEIQQRLSDVLLELAEIRDDLRES